MAGINKVKDPDNPYTTQSKLYNNQIRVWLLKEKKTRIWPGSDLLKSSLNFFPKDSIMKLLKSIDPFYSASNYKNWVITSWTYSIIPLHFCYTLYQRKKYPQVFNRNNTCLYINSKCRSEAGHSMDWTSYHPIEDMQVNISEDDKRCILKA